MPGDDNSFASNILTSHDTLGEPGASISSSSVASSDRAASPCPQQRDSSLLSTPSRKERPHYTRDTWSSAAKKTERAERRRERISARTRMLAKSSGSSMASDTDSMFSNSTSSLARGSDVATDDGHEGGSGSRRGGGGAHDESTVFGGPADFTMNMTHLMRGLEQEPLRENPVAEKEEDDEGEATEVPERHLDAYSEIEPPLDTSTPMRRASDNIGELSPDARAQLIQEIEQLRDDIRQLNKMVDWKCEEVEARDEIIQTHCNTVRSREETIDDFRQAMASLTKQLEHLQVQYREKQELLERKEAEFDNAMAKLEALEKLQSELDTKETELQHMKAENERLQQQQGEAGDAAVREQELTANHAQEKEALEAVMKEKDVVMDQMASQMAELKAQQHSTYSEVEKLEREVDGLNKECFALEEKNDSLFRTVEELEVKLSEAERNLQEAQAESQSRADALKAFAAEFEVQTEGKTFQEIVQSVKETLLRRAQKDAMRMASASEQTKVPELEAHIHELESKIEELAEMRQQAEERASQLREELETSASQSEKQESEIQLLRESLQASESSARESQQEIEDLRQLYNEVAADKDNVIAEVSSAKASLAEAIATIEQFKNKEATSRGAQQDAATQTQTKAQEQLMQQHKADLESINSAHAASLAALKESHAETRSTLEQQLDASQARERTLQDELSDLKAKLGSYEAETTRLGARNSKLESLLEAKEAAAAAMDKKVSAVMRRREEEWQRRTELLLKDRDRMGRLLMLTIGEKEMGEATVLAEREGNLSRRAGQPYRYRYVEKEN